MQQLKESRAPDVGSRHRRDPVQCHQSVVRLHRRTIALVNIGVFSVYLQAHRIDAP